MECRITKAIASIACIFIIFLSGSLAQDNAGPCTCDLTPSACDPNCCCDSSCNATDIEAFAGVCTNDYSFSSVQSCFPSSIMFRNYTPYAINVTGGGGLVCIYYDGFTARNYYKSPQVENRNVTKLALKLQYLASFNFSVITATTNYSVYNMSYKAGTPVHTIYANDINPSYLKQPAALNSQACSYSAPALFMVNAAGRCSRTVTSATCAADGAISLGRFVLGFRVVPQPSVLTFGNINGSLVYSNLTEVTQASLTCRALDGSESPCGSTIVPAPALNASTGVCSNVLTSLTFNIKYRASSGIYEVSYSAVLGSYSVAGSGYALMQTFTTAFNLSQTSSPSTYPRSGNPGYITGKPVLAGTRNLTTNSVLVNPDPTRWLTVPGAGPNGACSSAASAARSVAFGESLQSSCWRQITLAPNASIGATACADISAAGRASLSGIGVDGATVVARFGNTADTSLTDWQLIHANSATCAAGLETQLATACVNVLLGAQLDLLMARTGSVTNPQSSLVGARLRCVRGNVTFQCAAGSCTSGSSVTQRFMSTYSVSFVDASSTPTSTAPSSIFQQRLMRDFFYLLYVENGVTTAVPASICWLLCLAAFANWLAGATNQIQ